MFFSCICSLSECWNVFISILNYGISIYTPMRRASMSYRCAKKYPLYIRQLLRKKSVAWRRYKHFKSAQLKSKYLLIKQKCCALIKEFTRQKKEQVINSNNLGLFYSHIYKRLVSKTGVGVQKDQSGSFVHSDSMKAELFNQYFSSVFTNDNNCICLLYTSPSPRDRTRSRMPSSA